MAAPETHVPCNDMNWTLAPWPGANVLRNARSPLSPSWEETKLMPRTLERIQRFLRKRAGRKVRVHGDIKCKTAAAPYTLYRVSATVGSYKHPPYWRGRGDTRGAKSKAFLAQSVRRWSGLAFDLGGGGSRGSAPPSPSPPLPGTPAPYLSTPFPSTPYPIAVHAPPISVPQYPIPKLCTAHCPVPHLSTAIYHTPHLKAYEHNGLGIARP
eukprot:2529083-Rhodomonas_salina.2